MSVPVAELTTEKVNAATAIIFEILGEPETDLHRQALQSFQQGDYQTVKRLFLEEPKRLLLQSSGLPWRGAKTYPQYRHYFG
ncbi:MULTISPECIES: hypothetical protein [Cyanophyceae]|uniref:hypothetical protein n=1 Tax=Cyanophyceae TaxID=3028117 RepID=UPI0018F05475|nr:MULTISPECIES: hypothetical protein [Cyanophyceae]